jgi:hypothetical protein
LGHAHGSSCVLSPLPWSRPSSSWRTSGHTEGLAARSGWPSGPQDCGGRPRSPVTPACFQHTLWSRQQLFTASGRQMNGRFGAGSDDLCHVRGIGSAASTAPSRIFSGRSGRPAPPAPLGAGSCCPAASSQGASPVHPSQPYQGRGILRTRPFRRAAEIASSVDERPRLGRRG